MTSYVCLVEIGLHFGEVGDLKQKRKELQSIKTLLRKRFGASVAETEHHDKWQRSTLLCALVGGAETADRADEMERFVESRYPDGSAFRRDLFTLADLRGV